MATEISTPQRTPSGDLAALSLEERASSAQLKAVKAASSFTFNARAHSSNELELGKFRDSQDGSSRRSSGDGQPKVTASRAQSFAEPSSSAKPPSGSKHRRVKSTMNLQKPGSPLENGGTSDFSKSPSPHILRNGRSRSNSFKWSETSPNSPPESISGRRSNSFSRSETNLRSPPESVSGRRSIDETIPGRFYTREEKGKDTAFRDRRQLTMHRHYSASQPSSRASSPTRSSYRESFSGQSSLTPQRSLSGGFSAGSLQAPKPKAIGLDEWESFLDDLRCNQADRQIRALRRIAQDSRIPKKILDREADNAEVVSEVAKCVEPAKSWLPQLGITDLQFHALVATRHLASHPEARSRISKKDTITTLIQLLKTGSPETQSYSARTLAYLANHPEGSFLIGQNGGCAALVGLLPSRAGLTNTYMSVQMAVDHDAGQANVALALSNLADATGNQQKMVEAGAITGLILCLTPGLAAIQAAAAKCLQKLAKDNEYHELIINAGALHALLQLLVGEETESEARAAATEAVGSVIKTERMAADTIPHLVAMAKSDQLKVKLAATRALGELASKSKFNRTKIAEEVECMPAIVEQLRLSDMQHRLTKVIEQRCMARSHLGLVARLRDALGEPHLRVVQSVMQQMNMSLTNNLDAELLVKGFRENAFDHQHAAIRLLQSLSLKGFSQSRVLQVKDDVVWRVCRLIKSEVRSIRAKALSCLASLSMQIPWNVQRELQQEPSPFIQALQDPHTKSQALRLLLNLAAEENALDWLVNIGVVPTLIENLRNLSQDIQFLASSCLANMTPHQICREMILETAGLESLCKLMQSDNSRAWGPAAQTLWQLIEDSGGPNRKGPDEDQLKIAEGIGALGGAKNAVLLLQSEDPDVIEQASSLIASLAKSQHNAAILANEGAIGHLILLLKKSSLGIRANAVEALGYIAAVSNANRHLIVGPSAASVAILLHMLEREEKILVLRAANCLAALCESRELAAELDTQRMTATMLGFLQRHPEQEEAGRAIILALAKHGRFSIAFKADWERLGGLDILYDLRWLKGRERQDLASTLNSLASGPMSPYSFREEHEEEEEELLEEDDHFDQDLPLSSRPSKTFSPE